VPREASRTEKSATRIAHGREASQLVALEAVGLLEYSSFTSSLHNQSALVYAFSHLFFVRFARLFLLFAGMVAVTFWHFRVAKSAFIILNFHFSCVNEDAKPLVVS
jgi:hypothetical protein